MLLRSNRGVMGPCVNFPVALWEDDSRGFKLYRTWRNRIWQWWVFLIARFLVHLWWSKVQAFIQFTGLISTSNGTRHCFLVTCQDCTLHPDLWVLVMCPQQVGAPGPSTCLEKTKPERGGECWEPSSPVSRGRIPHWMRSPGR